MGDKTDNSIDLEVSDFELVQAPSKGDGQGPSKGDGQGPSKGDGQGPSKGDELNCFLKASRRGSSSEPAAISVLWAELKDIKVLEAKKAGATFWLRFTVDEKQGLHSPRLVVKTKVSAV